eukprot:Skav222778  [mRNA]  locus=scaffold600:460272:465151:+ [translate_table: standard]
MDPAFRRELGKFDIHDYHSMFEVDTPNVLIDAPRKQPSGLYIANIVEAPLPTIKFKSQPLNWKGWKPTDKTVQFPVPTGWEDLLTGDQWLLCNFRIAPPKSTDGDARLTLMPTEHSCIIPWYHSPTSKYTLINLCAGGYGGWSYAMKFANEHGWPYHYQLNIEHSLPAAAQHAINHETALIGNQALPLTWLIDRRDDVTAVADLSQINFLQSMALLNSEIWTFSFPCQSWSSAANAKGFGDLNGQTFATGMGLARILRPRTIVLECVPNFWNHPQYEDAAQHVHWCGYRFIIQGIWDAGDRLPQKRPRYMAILQRMEEDPPQKFEWQSWGTKIPSSPFNWDCMFVSSKAEAQLYQLSTDEFDLYMDPTFLPKFAPYFAKENMWRYRQPQCTTKTPVIMASYGYHHDLPLSLLESKGLHGFFTVEHMKLRWYKPQEIALMHTQLEPIALLVPRKLAYQTLGNAILFHHAYAALYNALSLDYKTPAQGLAEHIELAEAHRLKATETSIVSDELACYLANGDTQEICIRTHFLADQMGWKSNPEPTIPEDMFFDPQHGRVRIIPSANPVRNTPAIVEISPTIPMPDSLSATQTLREWANQHTEEATGHLTPPPDVAPEDTSTSPAHHVDHHASCHIAHTVIDTPNSKKSDVAMSHVDEESTASLNHTDWDRIIPFLIPGTYGQMYVHPDTTMAEVLQLWNNQLLPCDLMNATTPTPESWVDKLDARIGPNYLAPKMLVMDPTPQFPTWEVSPVILADHDQFMAVYPIQDRTIDELIDMYPTLQPFRFDDCGALQGDKVPKASFRAFEADCFPDTYHRIAQFIQAATAIRTEVQYPPKTDIVVMHMHGDGTHLSELATFWKVALSDTWMHKHGRCLNMQVVDDTHIAMLLRPNGQRPTTPLSIFLDSVTIRLTQTALMAMSEPNGQVCIRFKLFSRLITTIMLADHLPVPEFLDIFRHTFALQEYDAQPSLVNTGQVLGPKFPLDELRWRTSIPDQRVATISIMMPLMGGGGNKADHKQLIHSRLATLFIEKGKSIHEIPQAIETMLAQYGIPQLTHMLFAESPDMKQAKFDDMCKQAGILVPVKTGNTNRTQAKLQAVEANKKKKLNRDLDISKYELQPGFFVNAAGQPIAINPVFSPCKPGITMTTPQQAQQWILSNQKILPDELGLLVVGDIEGIAGPHHRFQHVTAPAKNQQGQDCLIAGWIVQLGDKPILQCTKEQPKVVTNTVRLCSFTLWKTSFTDLQWKDITEAPVRAASQLLKKDGFDNVISTPHGRTYHQQGKVCPPNEADSIQFHAEVRIQQLRPLLRRSGFNHLWVVPKDATGQPSPDWRVIWMDFPADVIEAKALQHPATAGLVKGRKTTGLRVETKAFAEVWALFFPDREVPAPIPRGTQWKLYPLPMGIDRVVLQEWAASFDWAVHPLRPLGARAWVVGLVAGPRSKPTATVTQAPTAAPVNVFKTGDPFMDPWKPGTSTASSDATSSAGPTTAHLQTHDKQISEMQTMIQQLQHNQDQHKAEVDHRLQCIDHKITQHSEAARADMQTFQQDFASTLRSALQTQDHNLQQSMQELKQLFLRNDKRKTATADAEAAAEDSDMS